MSQLDYDVYDYLLHNKEELLSELNKDMIFDATSHFYNLAKPSDKEFVDIRWDFVILYICNLLVDAFDADIGKVRDIVSKDYLLELYGKDLQKCVEWRYDGHSNSVC